MKRCVLLFLLITSVTVQASSLNFSHLSQDDTFSSRLKVHYENEIAKDIIHESTVEYIETNSGLRKNIRLALDQEVQEGTYFFGFYQYQDDTLIDLNDLVTVGLGTGYKTSWNSIDVKGSYALIVEETTARHSFRGKLGQTFSLKKYFKSVPVNFEWFTAIGFVDTERTNFEADLSFNLYDLGFGYNYQHIRNDGNKTDLNNIYLKYEF